MVPGVTCGERETDIVAALSLASGRMVNWNAIFVDVNRQQIVDDQLAMNREVTARGGKVWGLCPAAPVKGYLNFRSGFTFAMLDGWKPFLLLDDEEKIAAMRDPATRARLKAGAEHPDNPVQIMQGLENYLIEGVGSAGNARLVGQTIGHVAAARGTTAFDTLFDIGVEENLDFVFSGPVMGADQDSWALREAVWNDPHVLIGASDAGAHLDMFNTFALTTQLLGQGVRERGIYTLEQGVRRLTGEIAEVFGFSDRGVIAVGAAADLVVFDPGTVDCGPIEMRGDLPGGEMRLYGDAVGIHNVIVNGVPVAHNNSPTGRIGGRMLRSGVDSYTVGLG